MVKSTRKQEIENLKAAIAEQREWGNNKVADLLAEELDARYDRLRGELNLVRDYYGEQFTGQEM